MKKKAPKKRKVSKRDEKDELNSLFLLRDKIISFMVRNKEYTVFLIEQSWIIAVKMVTLNIRHTANSEGFQPLERAEECKKWITVLVSIKGVGKLEDVWEINKLVDEGCPVTVIRSVSEIERKLGAI